MVAWRAGRDSLARDEVRAVARELYRRLLKSAATDAERLIFESYCARYRTHGFDVPALIPQVYLHYDPYTRRSGGTLARQWMDFLLLLPRRRRVVIELDGVQHYADASEHADPARYAAMAAADRELRLAGYEVYRFGGHEIADRDHAPGLLDNFFTRLLRRLEQGDGASRLREPSAHRSRLRAQLDTRAAPSARPPQLRLGRHIPGQRPARRKNPLG